MPDRTTERCCGKSKIYEFYEFYEFFPGPDFQGGSFLNQERKEESDKLDIGVGMKLIKLIKLISWEIEAPELKTSFKRRTRMIDANENVPVPTFPPGEMLLLTRSNIDIESATRLVEQHFFGEKALFARTAFAYINRHFFHGQLPWTLIVWGLTAHGHCLGQTHADLSAPPRITLHPSLLGGKEKPDPWGIPPQYLGKCYAFDVMLHECMHVSVEYLLGGQTGGESSHNCPAWVGEVNRIAPMLGFPHVHATMSKVTRVKGEAKVKRMTTGNISLDEISRFPSAIRSHYRDWSFYEHRVLPWETECYTQLDVTERDERTPP